MPRAVAIAAPSGPEVLDVTERDVRAAGPGEVRIAVGGGVDRAVIVL